MGNYFRITFTFLSRSKQRSPAGPVGPLLDECTGKREEGLLGWIWWLKRKTDWDLWLSFQSVHRLCAIQPEIKHIEVKGSLGNDPSVLFITSRPAVSWITLAGHVWVKSSQLVSWQRLPASSFTPPASLLCCLGSNTRRTSAELFLS